MPPPSTPPARPCESTARTSTEVDLFAVGHRVVHGGARFSAPVLIDDQVLRAVRDLRALAPLHNPANLEGIETALTAFPGVPQVAVFDTAFHQSMPPMAYTYAVARDWREAHRVRRYGFHGTSFAYVSRRACQVLGRDAAETPTPWCCTSATAPARCAVEGGRSVDTSMGLSPLEGLVMGTRSGTSTRRSAPTWRRVAGLDAAAYDKALNHTSGLKGLAGASDLREIVQRREGGDPDAVLAFDVMTYRLRKYVGAYAAALGRVEAIVFTGGIGENSPRGACGGAGWPGRARCRARRGPRTPAREPERLRHLDSAAAGSPAWSCRPTRSSRSPGPASLSWARGQASRVLA